MKEINIYGDIVAFKFWEDGNEYDLKDLKEALNSLDVANTKTLTINIHTYGGDTTTAFGMYNLIKRFKRENNITIRTRVDGYCASSGVILLLAGDERVGSKYLNPFVHNAWTWEWDGMNKNDARKIYEDLSAVDDAIATLYASETSISKEEALQFMDESRELTTEECQKYGFYTSLEDVIIIEGQNAFNAIKTQNKLNRNKMTKEQKTFFNGLKKQIDKFLGTTKNKIVYTALNEELDFYELSEEDEIKVGDKATFNGKPAGESNEGTYTLQSGEVLKFEGEELKEITEPEDGQQDGEKTDTEVENLKAEIETLKTENANLKAEITNAKNILAGFKNLSFENDDETKYRNGKQDPEPKRNLFKNIK